MKSVPGLTAFLALTRDRQPDDRGLLDPRHRGLYDEMYGRYRALTESKEAGT